MNERGDEANVPREPWRRLLEDPADDPPETTDARIRAAARRDLAPRGQRWWLPASLVASFVLAVFVVRSEIGIGGRVPIAATARGGDEAMDARLIDRHEGEQAREPGRSPSAPAPQREKQRDEAEPDVYGYADSELGQEAPGTGPRVGGPERELQSASELPEERPARIDMPAPAGDQPANVKEAAPPAPAPAAKATGELDASRSSIVEPPTPDAWYAAIEKLRRDGRIEEADRELERLKKAYPGWLEQHLKKSPPP